MQKNVKISAMPFHIQRGVTRGHLGTIGPAFDVFFYLCFNRPMPRGKLTKSGYPPVMKFRVKSSLSLRAAESQWNLNVYYSRRARIMDVGRVGGIPSADG